MLFAVSLVIAPRRGVVARRLAGLQRSDRRGLVDEPGGHDA